MWTLMLESELNTNVLTLCLMNPENAPAIVKSMKTDIIKSDFEVLLSSAATHPSAKYVATVVETTSWCRLWDLALDRGVQGTCGVQSLLKELSREIFDNFLCWSCGTSLSKDSLWFNHICNNHPDAVTNLSCEEIMSGIKEANVGIIIFSVANSKLNLALKLCIATLLSLYILLHYTMYFVYFVSVANALWVVQYKNFEL